MKILSVQVTRSFKHLTGSWTKYGGRRYNAIDNQTGTNNPIWYCQVCGEEQPSILSPIKIEIPQLGYIRVCSSCFVLDKFKNIHPLPENV